MEAHSMRGGAKTRRAARRLDFEARPTELTGGFVTWGRSFVTEGVQRDVSEELGAPGSAQRSQAATLWELAARLSVGFWRLR
jgi:hypothetical protein